MKDLGFVRLNSIVKSQAQFYLLFGARDNGKSYAVKERGIKRAIKTGEKFILCRRYDTDIKRNRAIRYFRDIEEKIDEWSNGVFDSIDIYANEIFLCKTTMKSNGSFTKERLMQCGTVLALNVYEHDKSSAFPNHTMVIYEEFITDNSYLDDETSKLSHLLSTVFRYNDGECWLIGNTVNRVCPYFSEWGIEKKIFSMKSGDIVEEFIDGELMDNDSPTKIVAYYTTPLKKKSRMIIGKATKNINRGDWATHKYPNCRDIINLIRKDTLCYTIYYYHSDNLKFKIEARINEDRGSLFLVVAPNKLNSKNVEIVVDVVNGKNESNYIIVRKIPEPYLSLIRYRKDVYFYNDLTGQDFYQCLKEDSLI